MIVLIVMVIMAIVIVMAIVIILAMVVMAIVIILAMVVMVIVVAMVTVVVVIVVIVLITFGDRQRMCYVLCMNLHFSSVSFLVLKHDRLVGTLRHVLAKVCYQYRAVVQCDLSRGHCMGLDGDGRVAA